MDEKEFLEERIKVAKERIENLEEQLDVLWTDARPVTMNNKKFIPRQIRELQALLDSEKEVLHNLEAELFSITSFTRM